MPLTVIDDPGAAYLQYRTYYITHLGKPNHTIDTNSFQHTKQNKSHHSKTHREIQKFQTNYTKHLRHTYRQAGESSSHTNLLPKAQRRQ